MNDSEYPDLFPDLPRGNRKKVSHKEILTAALNMIRQKYGVTTPQIAEAIHVPHRTVEQWMHGSSAPVEWSARMVLDVLRRLYPDVFPVLR